MGANNRIARAFTECLAHSFRRSIRSEAFVFHDVQAERSSERLDGLHAPWKGAREDQPGPEAVDDRLRQSEGNLPPLGIETSLEVAGAIPELRFRPGVPQDDELIDGCRRTSPRSGNPEFEGESDHDDDGGDHDGEDDPGERESSPGIHWPVPGLPLLSGCRILCRHRSISYPGACRTQRVGWFPAAFPSRR